MNRKRLIPVHRIKTKPFESSSFRLVVNKHYKKLFGVLVSNDTDLSLSLSNETELQINGFEYTQQKKALLPPSKRILTWEEVLNTGDVISGSITNLKKESRIINVYLLIEEQC